MHVKLYSSSPGPGNSGIWGGFGRVDRAELEVEYFDRENRLSLLRQSDFYRAASLLTFKEISN